MARFPLLFPLPILCALLPAPLRAAPPVHAVVTYDAYAAGLRAMRMQAELALSDAGYSVRTDYRTTGLVGALVSSHQVTTVTGLWNGEGVSPRTFDGEGEWNGSARSVRIAFGDGLPQVERLTPPNTGERDAVPAEMTRDTEDTLSPMAQLTRQVTRTGRCDGKAATYDGRRVVDITVRSAGMEALAPTGRSIFSGPALRCDFAGVLVAGFPHGSGPADHRPRRGSAWFARLSPDGPVLPVRIMFETPWLGHVTLYAAASGAP